VQEIIERTPIIPSPVSCILLFTIILAGCVLPSDLVMQPTPLPTNPLLPSTATLRYLALGDSYTIGQGVDEAARWPVQLTARLRAEGVPLADPLIIARTGWTTDELQAGIAAAAPQGLFDLVTLLIGVNNQYRGRDRAEYRTQFRQLLGLAIDLAAADPRRVIVVSIPDWGVTPFAAGRDPNEIAADIDLFNRINLTETEAAGARYVDVTPMSRLAADDPTLLAADQLHPSARMYRAWVDLIWGEARAVLRSD
jgi:lysophospholipase L1-like esterase